MYDVAIVGAGPAGSTLARLIGKDLSVLLIDRRELGAPGERGSPAKCCGGLLAPDAQRALGELGLGLPAEVLVGPQLFVVRAIDLPARLERFYQRHYINIDRGLFDRWLVSLIPPEVHSRFGCSVRAFRREGEAFEIEIRRGGSVFVERARILVGADGAGSTVRRLAFPHRSRPPGYVGVQEWFPADTVPPYFSAVFDPEITDFYCWTIPKGEHVLVGAALRRGRDCAAKFRLLLERLSGLGLRLARPVRRSAALILRPRTPGQVCIGGGGVALVGEAAGWISPSSAEGLSYAFRSAVALADALKGGADFLGRYRRNARALLANIVCKSLKSPFMCAPPLRRAVLRLGFRALRLRQP